MSDYLWETEVTDYIAKTQFGVLAYVREDKIPILRAMGSFVLDGLDLYFSSQKNAAKVSEIHHNKHVSFFFEQDNQDLASWKNVLLIGTAELVERQEELEQALELLGNRNPRFKERIIREGLASTAIFKVKTQEVEYTDRTREGSPVQKFKLT